MECILEAHPLPDILWYHVDTKLKNSDRIKMVRKSTSKYVHMLSLEIREPTIEDGGAYRCNAVNLYGESNANIALNFQGNSLSTTVHVLTIYIILYTYLHDRRTRTDRSFVRLFRATIFDSIYQPTLST